MGADVLLRVENLRKVYEPRNFFVRRRAGGQTVVALDGVNLAIRRGSVVGLAGASGCGKSTLANCIAGFERATSGSIWSGETDLAALSARERRAWCSRIQVIFQDSAGSFDPRFTAAEIIAEPLAIQGRGTRESRRDVAQNVMARVGLPCEWQNRTPDEFSGGQRQRLAIARALALEPELLILDESFSALDAWTQSRIADLLDQIRAEEGITCLHIAHDLALLSRVADEIAVMQSGQIVERAAPREILARPNHGAAKALVDAMPQVGAIRQGAA